MENKNLARRHSGHNAIEKRLSPPSEKTVLKLLDLAAQTLGKELSSGESRLWLKGFQYERPEALEWAFQEFFFGKLVDREGNVSGKFFPRPAEIGALLQRYKERTTAQRVAAEQQRMLDENRETRRRLEAAGQPAGLAQYRELMKECLEKAKRMP